MTNITSRARHGPRLPGQSALAAPAGRGDPGIRNGAAVSSRTVPGRAAVSCGRLNQLLADSQILYALYKKHHWLMRGATFFQLHLLLDKHAGEQIALMDLVAERVQTLGGVAVGDLRQVAEIARVQRAPDGCEEVPAMLSRLLEAHELILSDAHDAAARVAERGDDGTNDLIVSGPIRTGDTQAWFLAKHLVDTPLVRA